MERENVQVLPVWVRDHFERRPELSCCVHSDFLWSSHECPPNCPWQFGNNFNDVFIRTFHRGYGEPDCCHTQSTRQVVFDILSSSLHYYFSGMCPPRILISGYIRGLICLVLYSSSWSSLCYCCSSRAQVLVIAILFIFFLLFFCQIGYFCLLGLVRHWCCADLDLFGFVCIWSCLLSVLFLLVFIVVGPLLP